jgi:hypothetical protein
MTFFLAIFTQCNLLFFFVKKLCFRDHHLCVCIPSNNFWIHEPIFIILVTYIMTPESVSNAYFWNPCHRVIPLWLLCNGSVRLLPRQWIRPQQYRNCWTRRFLYGPCGMKGSYAISSSQNFLLKLCIMILKQHPCQIYVWRNATLFVAGCWKLQK